MTLPPEGRRGEVYGNGTAVIENNSVESVIAAARRREDKEKSFINSETCSSPSVTLHRTQFDQKSMSAIARFHESISRESKATEERNKRSD
jgi:hypothetical protein